MNCPKTDQLRLLSMQLVDPASARDMREHLRECERCGALFTRFTRENDELSAAHEAFHRDHDVQREQLMARLSLEPVGDLPPAGGKPRGGLLMRMNTPYGRGAAGLLAAAACIAVAFTVFSEGESKAFARMIERLREAQTIRCRVRMTMNAAIISPAEGVRMRADKSKFEQVEQLYISDEFGIRRDTYEGDVHVSSTFHTPQDQVVYLHHPRKQWHLYDPTTAMDPGVRKQLQGMMEDRAVPDLHLGLSSDPTYLIQALRDLTAEADTLLGWQEIEGVEALGFELSGAKAGFGPPLFDNAMDNMVRLWIDFQSALPVRVELHFVSKVAPIESTGMSARFAIDAVYDQFELDPPITAELFNAAIPADYTPIEEMTGLAPQFSEEALLESLRVFSELTGRYPSSLNTFSVAHEISFVIGSLQAKQIAAKSRGAGTADLPKVSEVGPKLQGFTYFTKLEADGAAPAYFGDKVKPGDGESILMQWTLPGGTTRVIYGDLSIETLP